MKIYEKDTILLYVQMDHLNGENMGSLLNVLYDAGAKNVQIINTITKKNRPGYIMIVDSPIVKLSEIENIIVKEAGSSGWHRINTKHCYVNVSIEKKNVKVKVSDFEFDFCIEGKILMNDIETVRPEFENCLKLKNILLENGYNISLSKIRRSISISFLRDEDFINF